MLSSFIITLALLSPGVSEDLAGVRSEMQKGKEAFARQQYAEAVASFEAAGSAAAKAGDAAGLIESLRMRASVQRDSGDPAQADCLLQEAASESAKAFGETSAEFASILEETAASHRAQGRSEQALAAIEKAARIREQENPIPRASLARDLTMAAVLRERAGETDTAVELLIRAIHEWDLEQPGDPQCLPALEAIASIYRDHSRYQDAEPLLRRALRMREAAAGLESADIIPALDSLAYVTFGLEKYTEAEGFYTRLRDVWEKNAGPDHPMVALTLDKLAEFYAFQHRYDDAEKSARAALALRAKVYISSLNQTGRVLLMEAKIPEAEDLYRRTAQIGDLSKAPDDVLDAPLRIYSKILRELGEANEADAIDKRVKDALIRKADHEGRRPSPVGKPSH
ncbi:MAG: tetratricopeptide repeat protein [Bryobacteraceae bacterium]